MVEEGRTIDKPVMGELLLKEGLLTREQLEEALEEQRRQGGRLGYHLIRLGHLNVTRLSQFLKETMGLIPYDLVEWMKDPTVIENIPANLAQFYQVVPVELKGSTLTVAIADLDNPRIIPALEELTGMTIDPVVCPREVVIKALEQFYGIRKDAGVVHSASGDHLFVLALPQSHIRPLHWSTLKPDSSATDWFRTILAEAIRIRCRTVVIRPEQDSIRVAFRTADRLEDRFHLHSRKQAELDALLGDLARLKDKKRGSRLEGRVRLQVESHFLSLHVKALGTLAGTRYTLNLYDEKLFQWDWKEQAEGLTDRERASLDEALAAPRGMVLLVGSPGAGITSLYYALLAHLRDRFPVVLALEDHALLPLAGIAQVEVSRQEDSNWPEQVTLAMKQEPDLLVCNPLKERQTTELALLAASRGAVLAVLHQADACSALRWLLRNGFRSPLKAGVLKGILTVASVSRLCPNCKIPIQAADPEGRPVTLYTRQGCEKCLAWDGLHAEAVLEWLPLTPATVPLEETDCNGAALRRLVEEAGGEPLTLRVLQRAKEGRLDGSEARDLLVGS